MSLIITYDIHNNRTRLKLSKYLERSGRRLQKSVFEMSQLDSLRYSQLIIEIRETYKYKLKNLDSILIIDLGENRETKLTRLGTAIKQQNSNKLIQ